MAEAACKTFVLDTNVILHNAEAITSFGDNEIVLPIEVIEELDNFKKDTDEKGRNARESIRLLDSLRRKGRLGEGVQMDNGGVLRILMGADFEDARETMIMPDTSDNRIILSSYILQKHGRKVIFVSKDINARVKADALGIISMDFEKQKVDFEKLYFGWRQLGVSKSVIDELFKNKSVEIIEEKFLENEFILLFEKTNPQHTAVARCKGSPHRLQKLLFSDSHMYSIKPRNLQQIMAQELLLDDSVTLVSLMGRAGTGKTLLALAAALKKVHEENRYNKILVSRPIMPLGRDIGYLPGTKEEKLESWMEPIFDNLEYILYESRGHEKQKYLKINNLIDSGQLQLEALTYMRGRSIPEQFIVIDEAQNLTPHEIKTVISRAGNGAKMVFTGDPYQIDNPYLDSSSNGLTYCVEKLKGHKIFGNVMLDKSERSELASLAAEIL